MPEKKKDRHNLPVSVENLERGLLNKNPHLFEELSDKKKSEIIDAMKEVISVEIREITFWERKAPLPIPLELKEYYEIKKEYADTIVQMARDDQSYVHSRDNIVINKSFQAKVRGQNYALIIAIIAIVGGITCILFDHEISGSIVSGVGLTGLVSEFLGRSKKSDTPENTK